MKRIITSLACLIFAWTLSAQNIVEAEYFWDQDPGFGNGIALSVDGGTDEINQNYSISTVGLPQGRHTLCVRTKSADGYWSIIKREPVFVHSFSEAEYFWDQDPGFGNGSTLALNSDNDDLTSNYTIPTTGVREGHHILYTRARGTGDAWSIATAHPVYIENKVVAAEYYWNSDPGVGNGTALDIGTPSSEITFTDDISTVGLDTTVDIHCLVVRTQAMNDSWSVMLDTCLFLGPVGVDEWNIASSLNMYPNPANTTLRISFESPTIEKINYSIYNSAGQVVMNKGFIPTSTTITEDIDVRAFEAGVYFISMQSADKTVQLIFVKE